MKTPETKRLGKALKARRLELKKDDTHKWSQAAVAKRTGVVIRAYQAWEAGEQGPSGTYAVRLERVMGMSLADMVDKYAGKL